MSIKEWFKSKWKRKRKIGDERQAILDAMDACRDTDPKRYDQLTKDLVLLERTRTSARVKPDTLVVAGVNLAGIVAVLKHEELHIIASKAWGMIQKLPLIR